MALGMMGTATGGIGIVLLLVSIVIGALFLWLSAKIYKLHNKSFTTPLLISAIVSVVSYVLGFIPLLNYIVLPLTIVLGVWLIKDKYRVDWGKAVLVWLVYFALSFIATLFISTIFISGYMASMMGV